MKFFLFFLQAYLIVDVFCFGLSDILEGKVSWGLAGVTTSLVYLYLVLKDNFTKP